jgi:hypothetical protein
MIRRSHIAAVVLTVSSTSLTVAQPTVMPTTAATTAPALVIAPPERIFDGYPERDRLIARDFYKKYLDLGGLSILAAESVSDEALLRTREIVSHLLAGRPDVLQEMQKVGTRLIVIGKDQVYTEMPDYRHEPDPAYVNERVRGTGGLDVTSFGEENLLNLPIDRYDDESIAVHEFCHTIDAALEKIDPTWNARLGAAYQNATNKGRWKGAYAGSNPAEYWAELAQSYFNCNRINNWNHTTVSTREQLKQFDPEGYEFVRTTFNLNAADDWRFSTVRKQPSVIRPPAKFGIDSYFTKFTFARELPIIASGGVSDEAMLRANDTVRKLFAYRHDILKVLINDGARLVVLGRSEKLSDLPQLALWASTQPAWDDARYLDYIPRLKVMVVPEENVLGESGDPFAGASSVVRVMARAAFTVTARRPVDPNWELRPGRTWQQYELRVTRLDERFGAKMDALLAQARQRGLWRGTPAWNDSPSYFSTGVAAYFDASGDGDPPSGAARPITSRETLRFYDPDLFEVIDQTFAYNERADWRYTRPKGGVR